MQHSSHHGPTRIATTTDFSDEVFLGDPILSNKVRKKKARVRFRRLVVLFTTVSVACFALFLGCALIWAHAEYRTWQARVAKRDADLAACKKILTAGKKRLAALQSPMGQQELLIENGYIKPGDRILQFPSEIEDDQPAVRTPNDLTPPPADFPAASPGDSTLKSVVKAVQVQFRKWREGDQPALAAVPR
jgi:hypothetical protein